MSSDDSEKRYYDLYTRGIGFLNSVRDIEPENGLPFLSVQISAMRGELSKMHRTRFTCSVAGEQTIDFVRALETEVNAGKRVVVGFRLSDVHPQLFWYSKGQHKGRPGIALYARLYRLDWARVNGSLIEPPRIAA